MGIHCPCSSLIYMTWCRYMMRKNVNNVQLFCESTKHISWDDLLRRCICWFIVHEVPTYTQFLWTQKCMVYVKKQLFKVMDSSQAEFTWSTYGSVSTLWTAISMTSFFFFFLNFRKKWRKNLSFKFMNESSVRYLWIHKWNSWIRP